MPIQYLRERKSGGANSPLCTGAPSGWMGTGEAGREGSEGIGQAGMILSSAFSFLPNCPSLQLACCWSGEIRPGKVLSLSPGGARGVVCILTSASFASWVQLFTSTNLLCLWELGSLLPERMYFGRERKKKMIPLKQRWVKEKATLNKQPTLNL